MNWTVESILSHWDELFPPSQHNISSINYSSKKLIASYLTAAFELRQEVGRCRAWRLKSSEQIDEEFMRTVVLPLVLFNPRFIGNDTLSRWNHDYQDQRGRKPSEPKDELKVLLSLLKKRELAYFNNLKLVRDMMEKVPNTYDDAENVVIDLIKSTRLLREEIASDIKQRKLIDLYPLHRVIVAMQHLISIGIPCRKIEPDVYWIRLIATVWGIEPNIIYSAVRKIKNLKKINLQ